MSHQQIKEVAAEAPTTMDELSGCGLPENIQKMYGERLVKNVKTYIEINNLQSYLDNRPKKKPKPDQVPVVVAATKAPNVIDVIDSGDEFEDDGIDFAAIEMPGSQSKAATESDSNGRAKTKLKSSNSSYFK